MLDRPTSCEIFQPKCESIDICQDISWFYMMSNISAKIFHIFRYMSNISAMPDRAATAMQKRSLWGLWQLPPWGTKVIIPCCFCCWCCWWCWWCCCWPLFLVLLLWQLPPWGSKVIVVYVIAWGSEVKFLWMFVRGLTSWLLGRKISVPCLWEIPKENLSVAVKFCTKSLVRQIFYFLILAHFLLRKHLISNWSFWKHL